MFASLPFDIKSLIVDQLDPISRYALGCAEPSVRKFENLGPVRNYVQDHHCDPEYSPNIYFAKNILVGSFVMEICYDSQLFGMPSYYGIDHVRFIKCNNLYTVDAYYVCPHTEFIDCDSLTQITTNVHRRCMQVIGCSNLTHIVIADSIDCLIVRDCHNLESIRVEGSARTICLDGLTNLIELQCDGVIDSLQIVNMSRARNLQNLNVDVVHHLYFKDVCDAFDYSDVRISVGGIRELYSLIITNSNIDLNGVDVERNFAISDCFWLTSAYWFSDVPVISIRNCKNLQDISALDETDVLVLVDLPEVTTPLATLASIPTLRITRCPKIF